MRLRRTIFITLGVILGLAVLIPWIYHCHLQAINEAYLAQLADQGEPMTLAQVLPPPVPDSENSADTFLKAAALLEADTSFLHSDSCGAMLPVAPGKAAPCFRQPAEVGYESTNSWEEVSRVLAQNQSALELLRQIPSRVRLDFHIKYERGMGDALDFTNLHFVELRMAVKYLASASESDLHNRNVDGAVNDEQEMLALINAAQGQRLEISELVRIAMLQIALGPAWEILQAPGLNETQLAALQNAWEQPDLIQGACDAMAMERVVGEITLQDWRHSPARFGRYLNLGKTLQETMGAPESPESKWHRAATDLDIFMWQYWWSYPDELRALKGYEVLLKTFRSAAASQNFESALRQQQDQLGFLQITNLPDEFLGFTGDPDFHSLMSQSINSLARVSRHVMTGEAARRITITAIALQRFKLAHGHFPNHLSGLIPEFLTNLPIDPVDGQPLHYLRQPDGTFLLYSVGENGVDDGGNPSLADHSTLKTFYWLSHEALDWVWPQATTADDVQFIYQTPAK